MILCGAETWDTLDPADPPDWAWSIADALRGMYPEAVGRLRDHDRAKFEQYRDKPAAYIREVLQGQPTPKQEEIAAALLKPPYKVLVPSCNNYGKTQLGGSLINWFYDAFDPGVAITTAPTARDVEDVLWKEVRSQRRTRWDFPGPKGPELYDRPDHYAKGYTGDRAEAFHGRHDQFMFFVLDEAVALGQFVWTGIKSMFKRNGKHLLLGLFNPTDTTSPCYAEAESGNYTVIRLSALEHPNIVAQLRGADDPPIAGAVDVDQLADWLSDPVWFEEIHESDFTAGDVIWPPPWTDQLPPELAARALARFGRDGKRVCYRPGPEGQARVLGLWPTATPGAVWSDVAWKAACRELDGMERLKIRWRMPPAIGCDVARGTSDRADKVAIVVQIEGVAVEHITAAGWDTVRTYAKLIELADKWARVFNANRDPREVPFLRPELIPIKIDDGAMGSGVVDMVKAKAYCAVPVNASTAARNPERYPIMRDQLWFAVPLAARRGEIDLSRLPKRSLIEMRRQAMAVQWKPDIHGRRKVEKKDETKKRINRSPDDMDGVNLAFCAVPAPGTAPPVFFQKYTGPLPGSQPPPPGPFLKGSHAH